MSTCVIHPPHTSTEVGVFSGIPYIRHEGLFTGTTGGTNGEFIVAYEITAPEAPSQGNGTLVFEPPHFGRGAVARDDIFGQNFFFGRGFSHGMVAYSNLGRRFLVEEIRKARYKIGGKFITEIIQGVPGDPRVITDYGILKEFGRCLNARREGRFSFRKLYSIGFSDSGIAVRIIYEPAREDKIFDISFPCIGFNFDPVRGDNKIMVLNTEAEFGLTGKVPPVFDPKDYPNYRCYDVPGGAHIPDNTIARSIPTLPFLPPIAGTSPMNWAPVIKALFDAGDRWVGSGMGPVRLPPPSVQLERDGNFLARDERCNARGGIRHPALELGEATFMASVERGLPPPAPRWPLYGGYGNVRPLSSWDVLADGAYLSAFRVATRNLVEARFLLPEDAEDLIRKAGMDRNRTFTESYMAGLFPVSIGVMEETAEPAFDLPYAVPVEADALEPERSVG